MNESQWRECSAEMERLFAEMRRVESRLKSFRQGSEPDDRRRLDYLSEHCRKARGKLKLGCEALRV